jgi:cell division septation protein DedD
VKERLTGAIILVVLIVLLVPELLSGPSRSAPAPQAAATSSEEPPLRSYTINLADDSHSAASSAEASNGPPQASGPAQPTPITEAPTAALQADSNSSTEGPPTATQAAVQTTPPASAAPGESPQEQPQAAPPHAQTAPSSQPRQSAAEKTTSGGWMVQLGVFSIQANAERLAQELKSQGFHALVSENSAGGRPLWRVRAGPVTERAAAEQLNAKLRTAGHAGAIVPK